MFKSKSYNVKKVSEKNNSTAASSSNSGLTTTNTMTLKKKIKLKAQITKNRQNIVRKTPQKVLLKPQVKKWVENKTYKDNSKEKK